MKTIVLILLICSVSMVYAADTLRQYDHGAKLAYYRDPAVVAQATRFDVPRPLTITALIITLGGPSANGTAAITVYGHEGGLPAPFVDRPVAGPITIRKSRRGVERIYLPLPSSASITGSQFFVVVDRISSDVVLLSDKQARKPSCQNEDESFGAQYLKRRDGRWQAGAYAFAVEAVVEYSTGNERPGFTDVTAGSGISDSLNHNRCIAWADYDGDTRLDLLSDGRLYHNDGNGAFSEVTSAAGLRGSPKAHPFIDLDNDGHVDILFLGGDSGSQNALFFRNDGQGHFQESMISIPRVSAPASFSIADVNNDGRLDLFIGQYSTTDSLSNYLLLNQGGTGFRDVSHRLIVAPALPARTLGSQWIDFDNDGYLDLFIAGFGRPDELWRNDGDSTFSLVVIDKTDSEGSIGRTTGCDWVDYDNDGDLDLLRPQALRPGVSRLQGLAGSGIIENSGTPEFRLASGGKQGAIEYESRHAGGTWGDVDNDSYEDLVMTTSCDCRYMRLYRQRSDHGFDDRTAEAGLRGVPAGPDAVWVDYDGDGWLDLATIVQGKLRLYHNNAVGGTNGHVGVEIQGGGVGAKVTVHVGDRSYTKEVSSGRGLLMQAPLRLHFGLGQEQLIDSIEVVPLGSDRRLVYKGLMPNRLNRLGPVASAEHRTNGVAIRAIPNPFISTMTFSYALSASGNVRLAIYSSRGDLVATLVDETQQTGEHNVTWNGLDTDGRPQPQGVYIYRLTTAEGETQGRLIRVR